MGHTGAAVMRQHAKAGEAVVLHHVQRILRHRPFGIHSVAGVVLRTCRVAVPPQIHQHHGEMLRQRGRHQVPHHMALGVAVQQQQRRPLPRPAGVQHPGAALHRYRREFWQQHQMRSFHMPPFWALCPAR